MKKLSLMAAMLVLGLSVQAASFSWGGYVGNDTATSGEAGMGTYATLIFMGTEQPLGAVETWDYTTGLTNLGGELMATYTLSQTDIDNYQFAQTFGRPDPEGGVNGWWMTVVYDPNQTADYFGYYLAELTGLADNTGAGDFTLRAGWNPGEYLDAGQQLQVVPEPSSMALLALGVAAIGLRRRFRK